MTLRNLEVGASATIKAVHGEGRLRNRLLDMGLTPKVAVRKIKVAPLGDPMQISVRGYELTIRNDDADMIEVEEASR